MVTITPKPTATPNIMTISLSYPRDFSVSLRLPVVAILGAAEGDIPSVGDCDADLPVGGDVKLSE